jgi:pyruvate,water dikinase
VLWYNQLGMNDVDRVGGKNASLGEMITNLSGMGVSVPNGFATTADAFNLFLDQSGVNQRIYDLLDKTDIDDVSELAKAWPNRISSALWPGPKRWSPWVS